MSDEYMTEKEIPLTLGSQKLSWLRTRRARNIMASIVVPQLVVFVLQLVAWSTGIDGFGLHPMEISLGLGFLFLLREFRIVAVLLCWAYFIPMYWITLFITIMTGAYFFGGGYP